MKLTPKTVSKQTPGNVLLVILLGLLTWLPAFTFGWVGWHPIDGPR